MFEMPKYPVILRQVKGTPATGKRFTPREIPLDVSWTSISADHEPQREKDAQGGVQRIQNPDLKGHEIQLTFNKQHLGVKILKGKMKINGQAFAHDAENIAILQHGDTIQVGNAHFVVDNPNQSRLTVGERSLTVPKTTLQKFRGLFSKFRMPALTRFRKEKWISQWDGLPEIQSVIVNFKHLSSFAQDAVRRRDLEGIAQAYAGIHPLQGGTPNEQVVHDAEAVVGKKFVPQSLPNVSKTHEGKYRDLLQANIEPTHVTLDGSNNLVFLEETMPDALAGHFKKQGIRPPIQKVILVERDIFLPELDSGMLKQKLRKRFRPLE